MGSVAAPNKSEFVGSGLSGRIQEKHTCDTAAGSKNCSRTLQVQNLLLLFVESCGTPSFDVGFKPEVARASSCRNSESSFGLESEISGDMSACNFWASDFRKRQRYLFPPAA